MGVTRAMHQDTELQPGHRTTTTQKQSGQAFLNDTFPKTIQLLKLASPTLSLVCGGALNHYILNQDISKWHFSVHGAV